MTLIALAVFMSILIIIASIIAGRAVGMGLALLVIFLRDRE